MLVIYCSVTNYHKFSGFKHTHFGNSLAVQWLGLHAFTAEGAGSIPGQGTKILQAEWRSKKKNKNKNPHTFYLAHISMHQESRHSLTGSSAWGLTGSAVQMSTGLRSHQEVQLRQSQLPSSLRLLEEFISLQLQDVGPWLRAGCP